MKISVGYIKSQIAKYAAVYSYIFLCLKDFFCFLSWYNLQQFSKETKFISLLVCLSASRSTGLRDYLLVVRYFLGSSMGCFNLRY